MLLFALILLSCAARAPAPVAIPPEVTMPAPAVPAPAVPAPLASAGLAAAMDFQDPAGSEARYRGLLPRARDAGVAVELELWTRLARCQGLQGNFDAAHATLDTVEARLAEAPGDASVHVRLPLERGRVHNSSGDPADAAPLFATARSEAARIGHDPLWLDAVHMQAIVAEPDDALARNREAIAFAEQSTDAAARAWLGALYNNTGWTHMDRGEHAEALALFEKGVAFRQEAGLPGPLRIARYTVGAALRKLDRCEEALAIQRSLHAEHAAEGAVDGYVEEELGECLLATGRADEARPHFAAAHGALSADPWMVEHQAERLSRLAALGGVAEPPR